MVLHSPAAPEVMAIVGDESHDLYSWLGNAFDPPVYFICMHALSLYYCKEWGKDGY